MKDFDLRKYLAENNLLKEEISKVLSENQLDQIEDSVFKDGWGFIEDYRREDETGINKKIAFLAYKKPSEDQKEPSPGQSLNVGSLDNLTPEIDQQSVNQLKVDYQRSIKDYLKNPTKMKITKDMIKPSSGVEMVIVVNHNVDDNMIIEI